MVKFSWGFLCCLCLFGCAAFSARYYGLTEVDYSHGKLLGPTVSDDLPFSKCEPNQNQKAPCVVMLVGDFFALKKDYLDTQQKLIECEKKLP